MLLIQSSFSKSKTIPKEYSGYGQKPIIAEPMGYGAPVSLSIPGLINISTGQPTVSTAPGVSTVTIPTTTAQINWTPIIILGAALAGILALILLSRKRSNQ